MKIILTLFLFFFLAECRSQKKVTISVQYSDLETVLKLICKQTDIRYFSDVANFAAARPITITLYDVPLETALRRIFDKQPVTYCFIGQTVAVVQKGGYFRKN